MCSYAHSTTLIPNHLLLKFGESGSYWITHAKFKINWGFVAIVLKSDPFVNSRNNAVVVALLYIYTSHCKILRAGVKIKYRLSLKYRF